MKQYIRLFIEDQEADLSNNPDILFNYSQTDVNNPTVIKNGYSKTVSLEGTQRNCEIFGNIWDLERVQSGNFNPSKKASYKLYVDNEIIEAGYLKLNSISRKKDIVVFNVTLYSSLGEFFYALSYNANGDKLKLSDLTYLLSSETINGQTYTLTEGGDDEFDMVITKENLCDAWTNIEWTPAWPDDEYRKYGYINFAPCYNAIPSDNFSADKVLINFDNDTPLTSAVTEDGTTFTPRNGYALGTLPEKADEWGTRDLRSYLQRPVLRFKALINAIKAYAENEGYDVELSPTFFTDSNPYYTDTWMTLPLLTEMELVGSDAYATKQTVGFDKGQVVTVNGWYNTTITVTPNPSLSIGSERIEANIDFYATDTSSSPMTSGDLYTSALIGGEKNFSAFAIQLLAIEGPNVGSGTIVGASDAVFLTSKVGNQYLTPSESQYTTTLNKGYFNDFGKFEAQGDGSFKWSNTVKLTIDKIPPTTECFALRITCVANVTTGTTLNGVSYQTYGYRRGRCYTSTTLSASADTNTRVLHTDNNRTVSGTTADAYIGSETAGYSGARISKRTLLDTNETPADYLISFCKMFNLHFLKNPYNKQVKILTRGEYYKTDDIVDIQGLIDRKDYTINPLTFDKKYYDFELESVGGDFSDKYKATYSRTYGSQRVDTGYEFDVDPKSVLSGSTLKSCVQGVQKSKFYLSPTGTLRRTPAYVFNGFKYNLYNGSLSSGETTEVTATPAYYELPTLGGEKYYDWLDKPQFADADGKSVKGEKVLLFYNGKRIPENSDGETLDYILSDDLSEMGVLNDGTPCYLYSENEFKGTKRICILQMAIPYFSRYKVNGNLIQYSLDFGEPKQLYINGLKTEPNGTIYSRYWNNYINDLYDINNRIVMCKMQLEKRPSYELLRKFYWFNNCHWLLNKIKNYNVCSMEPTECEFIKVKSLGDYTDAQSGILITASKTTVPSGTTNIDFQIESSAEWITSADTALFTGIPVSGVGNVSFTATLRANVGPARDLPVYVIDANDSSVFSKVIIRQQSTSTGSFSFDLAEGYTKYIPSTGGTIQLKLTSNLAWSVRVEPAGRVSCTISPSSGTATTDEIITITFGAYGTATSGSIIATNSNGEDRYVFFEYVI